MSQERVMVLLLVSPLLVGAIIAVVNARAINGATERAESVIRGWQRRIAASGAWYSRFLLHPLLRAVVAFCDWTDRLTHLGLKNGTRVAATLYLIAFWLIALYIAVMIVLGLVALAVSLWVVFKVLENSGSTSDAKAPARERQSTGGSFATKCGSCGSRNHATQDCPHGVFSSKCGSCGSLEHATSDCPHGVFSSKCGSCGSRDHATGDCPHGMFASKCGSCGSLEHGTGDCPHGFFSSECGNCGSRDHATSECPH